MTSKSESSFPAACTTLYITFGDASKVWNKLKNCGFYPHDRQKGRWVGNAYAVSRFCCDESNIGHGLEFKEYGVQR